MLLEAGADVNVRDNSYGFTAVAMAGWLGHAGAYAALVDGLSNWGAFTQIVVPIALPGMVAAFILSLVLCWNEYFFAALLTSTDAKTLPVMVASQTGSQGINWWSMAALSAAAIAPLLIIGIVLERYIIKGMAAGAVK